MPINHDDEYHTEHPWPKDVYWNEVTSFKPCERERLAIEAEKEQRQSQRLLSEESWRAGYDVLTEGALGDYPEDCGW